MVDTKFALLVVCGFFTHLLLDLIKIKREEGCMVSPLSYVKRFPYQTTLCVIGCVVGYVILDAANELTLATSYGLGMASNMVAEKIGQTGVNKALN